MKASRVHWACIGEVFSFCTSAVFLVSKKIVILFLKQVNAILRIQKFNSIFCLFFHQINYSPRRLPGFGLTDGEVLERLWSFLRRFGKMTKEMRPNHMRPNHRVDVLTDALLFYAKKRSASLGSVPDYFLFSFAPLTVIS